MAPVSIDDRALEALVELIGIRHQLCSALIASPERLAERIALARQAYASNIERHLAPYRHIAAVERTVREFEGLVATPPLPVHYFE